MKKENRKRDVQIHFRLTEDENAMFKKEVKKSGMTMNDYLIQVMVRRVGLSAVNCERILSDNDMELKFMVGDKCVGFASCFCWEEERRTQINSLFVIENFRNIGIEEQLFQEIEEFANMKHCKTISAYPGAEPYCPGGWLPLKDEKSLYEKNGYEQVGLVCNATPRMVKTL